MIDPGSIVLVDFPGVHRSKRRPAVVISTVLHQTTHGDIVVSELTSNLSQATGPTDYILQDSAAAGLHKASAFRLHVITKPISAIRRLVGKLTDRDWQEVQSRLRLGLAVT